MSRVYPPWSELGTLHAPLTAGERRLVEYLNEYLPPAWSIYVQPYLNDMRPDVVVVNPLVGIVVIEVKDWSLGRYRFEGERLIASTPTDQWIEADPVVKARWYAQGIYRQLLASDEAKLPNGYPPNDLAICRPAVYFHRASTQEAIALYAGREGSTTVFGSDWLEAISPADKHLRDIVKYCYLARSQYLREEQLERLKAAHRWLIPPRSASEQQEPSRLVAGQAEYAKPARGYRRVRGVAGAGKSFVLSHRAARANAEGRRVLVLSFNITMSHALRDLLMRAPFPIDWNRVIWGHFHAFAKKLGIEAGLIVSDAARGGGEDEDLSCHNENAIATSEDERMLAILEAVAQGTGLARGFESPRYGGIYIDEGQDFDHRWLDALAGLLDEGGELVLFADHRQNVYGQDGGRDAARPMRRVRFSGPWGQLPTKSHRLPWRVAFFLNQFGAESALGDEEDLAIGDFAERTAALKDGAALPLDVMAWLNVESTQAALGQIRAAMRLLGEPHPNDVVVLLPTHDAGMEAVELMQGEFQQIVHVFGGDGADGFETRRRKMALWMGRGGLKMCTVHSFKGWELDNVIVVWPSRRDVPNLTDRQRAALFYTAVSRGMKNLVVINADREYDRHGSDWDSFHGNDTKRT